MSARSKASTSKWPCKRNATGMLYIAEGPCNVSKVHNRCCPKDRIRCSSDTLPLPATIVTISSLSTNAKVRASCATVGPSNNSRNGRVMPVIWRTRAISRMANNECPPIAKKLSSTPTCGVLVSSWNKSHSMISVPELGARYAVLVSV